MHRCIIGAALVALALSGPAAGQEAPKDADLGRLREEVDRLKKKVDDLERRGPAAATPTATEADELKSLREQAAEEAGQPAKGPVAGAPGAPPASAGGGGGGSIQQRINAFNPRITAFGDMVGRLALGKHPLEEGGKEIDNHISLREVELDIRADVDPYAKAVLILSISKPHPQDDYGIDVEEGYVTLETLPANFRLKAGRWRQEFGVANNTHRHDLPWFDYPYPIQEFFGPDGLNADAVSLLWLAPLVPLQLQATVLEGTFEPLLTKDNHEPAYLARASYFWEIVQQKLWVQPGASLLYGKTTPGGGDDALLGGADFTLKYVENQQTSFVLTSELYDMRRHRDIDPTSGKVDRAWGWFAAAQLQPGFLNQLTGTSWERWYLGVRYDWDDFALQVPKNREWAASAFVSYYTTEFLRIRVGYEHREIRTGERGGPADLDTILVQLTWVFGSHPAEPYWVNR